MMIDSQTKTGCFFMAKMWDSAKVREDRSKVEKDHAKAEENRSKQVLHSSQP